MYKKYMTNEAYKKLVNPVLENSKKEREPTFSLTENRMTLESKKKGCCKWFID